MTAFTKAKVISSSLGSVFATGEMNPALARFDSPEYVVFPGFCDVHVHFREPGFSYKETISSGSLAAARGGYTAVCTMPNLNPVPDSLEHLAPQEQAIRDGACIHVYPYGSLTVEEKGEKAVDLAGMADKVIAFSDDGKGVQSDAMMEQAMLEAKRLARDFINERPALATGKDGRRFFLRLFCMRVVFQRHVWYKKERISDISRA